MIAAMDVTRTNSHAVTLLALVLDLLLLGRRSG